MPPGVRASLRASAKCAHRRQVAGRTAARPSIGDVQLAVLLAEKADKGPCKLRESLAAGFALPSR